MADRYNDWERRRRRDVDDDSDLYYRGGRGRDFKSMRNEYYGTGYQGGRRPQGLDRGTNGGMNEEEQYGWEAYNRSDYARSNRPDQYGRSRYGRAPAPETFDRGDYARGDYGYGRRQSRDFGWRDYEREPDEEWHPTQPPVYGPRHSDRYGVEGRRRWSRAGSGQRDWERSQDYGGEQPRTTWSYTEYWLIPGPHTGRGPREYQRSNKRIREDVCERITQHGFLDASDIEVEADEGIVRLHGMVDSRRAKRLAEDTAETVMGVWDIDNRLQIRRDGGHEQQAEMTGSKP